MDGGLRDQQLGSYAWWEWFSTRPWSLAVGLTKLVSTFPFTNCFLFFLPPSSFGFDFVADVGLIMDLVHDISLDLMPSPPGRPLGVQTSVCQESGSGDPVISPLYLWVMGGARLRS